MSAAAMNLYGQVTNSPNMQGDDDGALPFAPSVPQISNRASNRPVLDETPTGKIPIQIANAAPPSE